MAITVPLTWQAVQSVVETIYEDDYLLVVVKPAGLVMHPAYRHPDRTFWHLLVELFEVRGLPDHPRLLHRLDRDTSGLVCVPKHLTAHRRLERALQAGRFEKCYLALVRGRAPASGTVDAPLDRDSTDRRRMCVRADGQQARTHFTTLRRFTEFSLLRLVLETGRTHQIRVHLAHIGYPVVGDRVYGEGSALGDRLFLHADRLSFPHPISQRRIECRAPLPLELRLVLYNLRQGATNVWPS